jgi:hypothetical protein
MKNDNFDASATNESLLHVFYHGRCLWRLVFTQLKALRMQERHSMTLNMIPEKLRMNFAESKFNIWGMTIAQMAMFSKD